MDVSDLRKGILRALDDSRKDAAARRAESDRVSAAYDQFLNAIAIPMFRQAAQVLRAENLPFAVNTPAGSVSLVSDHGSQNFLELELDASATPAQVLGRTSRTRGNRGPLIEERAIAAGKSIEELTEADLSAFLLAEIPKLVGRP
jgi:hypothetical protein